MIERDIIIDLENPEDVEDIHKVQRIYTSIGSLLVSYAFRTLLIAFLLTFIISSFISIEDYAKNMGMIAVVMQIPISIYCTYYIIHYAKLRMKFDTSVLKSRQMCSWKTIFLCTLLVLGLNLAFSALTSCIELIFNQAGVALETPDFSYQSNLFYNVILIILTVIVGPIAEEILFRGVILSSLRPYGKKFSIVVSALLFALVHGNLIQTIPTFAIGCVLGYIAYEQKSILPAILVHALQNGYVMVFSFIMMYDSAAIFLLAIDGCILIATVYILWKYRKAIFFKEKPILSGAGYMCFFTRTPVIVAIVYYGVNMLLSFSLL